MTNGGVPFASIVICTRNRAESLRRTLETIVQAADGVTESWELVVVDNGSSDHTAAVVDAFAGRLPIRLCPEPLAGLSNARNAGVDAARGTYLIWTDDDVEVDADWLRAWLAAFRRDPDCAVFGGRAVPRFEQPEEHWFVESREKLASLLAIRDEPGWDEVTLDRIPYGLNYAVRAGEQRAHRYDPALGVAPGRRRGGEEVAVLRAMLTDGARGVWNWDAIVHHLIPRERQTADYILRYYTAHGFDFPVGGVRSGAARRLGAAARDAARSMRLRRPARQRSREGVEALVARARSIGSLQRHLGRREPR